MSKFFIFLISLYQKVSFVFFRNNCRFYPSCSEYTKQAILKYGVILGVLKGSFRILRCNPLSKGGFDPLK